KRLALALALAAALPRAFADELSLARPLPEHLDANPDEAAGWRAASDEKWIKTREIAEKLLKADANSYAAHYLLGVAMHYGEGDLARSEFHLERARSEEDTSEL